MESRFVFVDSGPFVIDLAFPQDARTGLTRRFLDRLRRSGNGVTSIVAVSMAFRTRGSATDPTGPDATAAAYAFFMAHPHPDPKKRWQHPRR